MLRAAGLPHKAKACRPRAFHYNRQADDVCAGSSDGWADTQWRWRADVLTVSSSVSGTPQSAAVVAPPPVLAMAHGVPG